MKSLKEQNTVERSFAKQPLWEKTDVWQCGTWGWGVTHFSSFVLDMMSSFQLTKIKAISPSVREPDSAIRFWKTWIQNTKEMSELKCEYTAYAV